MDIKDEISAAVRAMVKQAVNFGPGQMAMVTNEDGVPIPYNDNTLIRDGGKGGTPITVGGAKREKLWAENRQAATDALGFDPVKRNMLRAAGFAATALPAALAPLGVASAAIAHPGLAGLAVGGATGTDEGLRTNSVTQGMRTGLRNAATTTAWLGGPLWAAGLEGSLGAAADRMAAGGNAWNAALDAAITGGTYAVTGAVGRGMGSLANKVGPRVASAANRVIGPISNRIAANPIVKPVAKAVQTVVKSAPKSNMSALAAEQIAPAAIEVKDAVGERIAKKKQQAAEFEKWLRYGGAGLGGILAFMLANSMLNSNSGSSGPDKKREESTWERLLKSVLAAGVGAAGAYGGYKLGRTAYDYLYNQHKYAALMDQIKRTGGEAWNKVKSWFS